MGHGWMTETRATKRLVSHLRQIMLPDVVRILCDTSTPGRKSRDAIEELRSRYRGPDILSSKTLGYNQIPGAWRILLIHSHQFEIGGGTYIPLNPRPVHLRRQLWIDCGEINIFPHRGDTAL